MADAKEPPDQDTLSVAEMQSWLSSELRDSAKAYELRTAEARSFVDEYTAGKISSAEAANRLVSYDRRWGEALFGATARDGDTDARILAEIDRARDESDGSHSFSREVKIAGTSPRNPSNVSR